MQEAPLVSILCLSMNHAKYVKQAFESVVNQTYSNIEIIYVDNNSTDDTFEIADKIFTESGRPYKGFKREKNYTIPENVNFLIKHSSGKYIALLSGDDWWDVTNIEAKTAFYEQHQEYGILHCNGFLYNDNTGAITTPADVDRFKSGKLFDEVFMGGIYFPIGYIIRRDVFETTGLYDESLIFDDWDMWLRILEHFPIGYFDKPLVYYRRHDTTFFFISNAKKHREDVIKTLNKYKHHPLYKQAFAKGNEYYIYAMVDKKSGIEVIREIFRIGRFNWFYIKQFVKASLKTVGFYKKS